MFDMENSPVICHNFFGFIQEVIIFLWENTNEDEAELAMVGLNEQMRQILGEDEHPESLNQPELNDYYQGILNNDSFERAFRTSC